VTRDAAPSRTAYHRTAALAVAGVLAGAALLPATPVAAAAPAVNPSPTASLSVVGRTDNKLPTPIRSLDPALTVGGPRLASMGLIIDRPAAVPDPPALPCVAWLLADMDTGDIVAAKAPHAQLLPASTLKTLTALVTIPTVGAATAYRATDADARADGTRAGMVPGLTYRGRDLFNALIMASANDAAYALARISGGSGGIRTTLAQMNAKAAWLGAHDTVARDPAGLDAPGQMSSPYDLALIGRAAMQLPDFRAYAVRRQVAFPGAKGAGGKRGSFMISNHDKLLYNYAGTIGIKNGYTTAAHQTLISAVKRGDKTYLLAEMYGTNGSWRLTAAMFDWAFGYGSQVAPVGRLVEPGEVPHSPSLPEAAGPTGSAGPDGRQVAAAAAGKAAASGLSATTAIHGLSALWPVRGVASTAAAGAVGLALGWVLLQRLRARRRYASRHGG
jgi:D-alanyl-D-alanine carboxypeptidase (penicillin-binding protein 5/6)